MIQAERAAQTKYAELLKAYDEGDFYAHGFARQGPGSLKKGSGLDVDISDTDPTLDRLPNILKYGILSAKYARRIGLPFSRNFGNKRNDLGVSLIDYSRTPLNDAFDHAENGYNFARYETGRLDSLYAVAIRPFFPLQYGNARDSIFGYASFRRVRVAPRHFLALSTSKEVSNVNSATVDEVVAMMKRIYEEKPELTVPFVDRYARLLWPKKN